MIGDFLQKHNSGQLVVRHYGKKQKKKTKKIALLEPSTWSIYPKILEVYHSDQQGGTKGLVIVGGWIIDSTSPVAKPLSPLNLAEVSFDAHGLFQARDGYWLEEIAPPPRIGVLTGGNGGSNIVRPLAGIAFFPREYEVSPLFLLVDHWLGVLCFIIVSSEVP